MNKQELINELKKLLAKHRKHKFGYEVEKEEVGRCWNLE